MAEPLEYIALGEAIVLAGESLGLVGTAAELTEGALLTESAIGASSVVGLESVGGAALGASEIGVTEAAGLTGATVIGAGEVAASTAGATTLDSIFASAAAEVGLSSEGVAGAEVAQSLSWAERAGSLASKAGTVGAAGVTVAKASPYLLTGGDVASRVMSGEGVEEAIVNTAGDLTKIGAKAVSFSLQEFINDIDPSVLIVGGLAAYLYFSN